jgi:hypothetical protein
MLRALLVAMWLDQVLPGLWLRRRPMAQVRFDRAREPRHVANARALAQRITEGAPTVEARARSDEPAFRQGTSTSGGAGGAVIVIFWQSA